LTGRQSLPPELLPDPEELAEDELEDDGSCNVLELDDEPCRTTGSPPPLPPSGVPGFDEEGVPAPCVVALDDGGGEDPPAKTPPARNGPFCPELLPDPPDPPELDPDDELELDELELDDEELELDEFDDDEPFCSPSLSLDDASMYPTITAKIRATRPAIT
jgi:hypothetical protein